MCFCPEKIYYFVWVLILRSTNVDRALYHYAIFPAVAQPQYIWGIVCEMRATSATILCIVGLLSSFHYKPSREVVIYTLEGVVSDSTKRLIRFLISKHRATLQLLFIGTDSIKHSLYSHWLVNTPYFLRHLPWTIAPHHHNDSRVHASACRDHCPTMPEPCWLPPSALGSSLECLANIGESRSSCANYTPRPPPLSAARARVAPPGIDVAVAHPFTHNGPLFVSLEGWVWG